MIEAILPSTVIGIHASSADDAGSTMLPDETAALGSVADKRRREFATGRACARKALQRLGVAQTPVLIGPHREPMWPPGIVGSITHCADYRAAAVTRTSHFASIGIDAEPHEPLPPEILSLVALPEEQRWLECEKSSVHWGRVLFSAKESFYKTWFPLTGRWLDFHDVDLALDVDRGRFRIKLRVTAALEHRRVANLARGRFAIVNGTILCFCGVDAMALALACSGSSESEAKEPADGFLFTTN